MFYSWKLHEGDINNSWGVLDCIWWGEQMLMEMPLSAWRLPTTILLFSVHYWSQWYSNNIMKKSNIFLSFPLFSGEYPCTSNTFCYFLWKCPPRKRSVLFSFYDMICYSHLYCVVSHHILLCIVLYCIVLYCIVLYCIVLYCIALNDIVWYCNIRYCDLYCIVLHLIVLYCGCTYCIVWYGMVFVSLHCIVDVLERSRIENFSTKWQR